jgi:hypothetical protein
LSFQSLFKRRFHGFNPIFESSFEPTKLFFPDKEGGSKNRFLPHIEDQILEAFLLNPRGAKSKGDRSQICVFGEFKKNWFMIRGTKGKDFRDNIKT